MELLHHGVDQSVIALWLGHESVETTQIDIHADMRLKEKALAQVNRPRCLPRTLPAQRRAASLPRGPLIMPNGRMAEDNRSATLFGHAA